MTRSSWRHPNATLICSDKHHGHAIGFPTPLWYRHEVTMLGELVPPRDIYFDIGLVSCRWGAEDCTRCYEAHVRGEHSVRQCFATQRFACRKCCPCVPEQSSGCSGFGRDVGSRNWPKERGVSDGTAQVTVGNENNSEQARCVRQRAVHLLQRRERAKESNNDPPRTIRLIEQHY